MNPVASTRLRQRQRGFTLIETLMAVGIAGVLSSVAYPSFEGHVLRARRTDGLVALLQAQLAQERFRTDHRSYGSLAETGVGAISPGGHYRLTTTAATAEGFEILASATARQARDANCRHLRLSSSATGPTFASGPDETTANPPAANRKCWNQ